jgi:hypothetical protein
MNINKILSKEDEVFDEIEQNEKKLQNLKHKINSFKKDSIKEFVYTNRRIPYIWRIKKNYESLILGLFLEDNNLMKYIGKGAETTSRTIKNNGKARPKTAFTKRKNLTNSNLQMDKKIIIDKKYMHKIDKLSSIRSVSRSNTTNLDSINSSKFSKVNNKCKIKLRKIISSEDETENLFDKLKEKYSIKKKFEELFSSYNADEMTMQLNSNTSKNNDEKIYSIKSKIEKEKLIKIKKIQRNIYNNLLLKDKNKTKNYDNQRLFKKYKLISNTQKLIDKLKEENTKDNKKGNIKENKKEIIKNSINDSKIFTLLKSINFYGPYFSYCPTCHDNNINFYKNLDKNECLNLLNHIKLERSKKLDIEDSELKKESKRRGKSSNK